MENLIKINHKNKFIALIIKASFKKEGSEYFTPNRFPQQVAYMHRPRGYVITPHAHPPVTRSVRFTQEVLFVRSGKVRVDFYDEKKNYLESRIIQRGDVIFLAFGGHGFEFIQAGELIEVKQGPFLKKAQSVKFDPIKRKKLKLKNG